MARTLYDSLGLNENIELDLSMLEATGALLHDESKNHSVATMHSSIGTPLWLQTPSTRYGIYLNRIYPAFDIVASGTRLEDLLLSKEELKMLWILQKFLSTMNTIEGMQFLIDKIRKTKTNKEFLAMMSKRKNGS